MISSFRRRYTFACLSVAVGVVSVAALQQQGVSPAHAATFTVTSTADDGSTGTLRWAITQANSSAGSDTIDFDGSVSGVITLTSNLPSITDTLTITGPGQNILSIDGANLYRPFTFTFGSNAGKVLTLSDLTLRRGGGAGEGQVIFNSRGTINATNVTFEDTFRTAVFNKEAWSVATYTNCKFLRNGNGIAGDHGGTPSAVSNTDTDYQNRTYVVNTLFQDNSAGIFNYRFTKVTNSTFIDNNYGAYVTGLNRTQIYNSTFSGNNTAILHDSWTPTTWTSVGTNNRLHDGNTFTNNGTAFYLTDGWNNGQKSQQWTTITNNIWDGVGKWIEATRWNGSTNVADTVLTVNSAGRVWIESGNTVVSATTTTTTTTTSTTSTTTTTTVAPSSSTSLPTSSSAPSTTSAPQDNVSTSDNEDQESDKSSNVVAPALTSTTVAPATTTTTTTIPAPAAPEVASGEAGFLVDGKSVSSSLVRRENALVVSGGGIEASVYGVSIEGDRIDLDQDGLLRLTGDDRIVVEASGFTSGETVDIWMYSTPTLLGSLEVAANGSIQGYFNIPTVVNKGEHRVVLSGQNDLGQDVVLGIGISVGNAETTSLAVRLAIIIPVALAVIAGLLIPTAIRRRRDDEDEVVASAAQ